MMGEMITSSGEYDDYPDQIIELTIPIKLSYHQDHKRSHAHLKLAGISLSSSEGEIGSIDQLAVGAGIVVSFTKLSPFGKSQNWYISGADIWDALVRALGQEEMILDEKFRDGGQK